MPLRSSTGLCLDITAASSTQIFFRGITLSDSQLAMPCVPCRGWGALRGKLAPAATRLRAASAHRTRLPARCEAAGAAAGERWLPLRAQGRCCSRSRTGEAGTEPAQHPSPGGRASPAAPSGLGGRYPWALIAQERLGCLWGSSTPLHRPLNPGIPQRPGAEGWAPQEQRARRWLPEPSRMEAAAARPASG